MIFITEAFIPLSTLRLILLEIEKGFCDERQDLKFVCVAKLYNPVRLEENTRLVVACLNVSAVCWLGWGNTLYIQCVVDAISCVKHAPILESFIQL